MPENSPRLHVLVVDDEFLIRWSVAETLTRSGHQIVEAGDGAAAVLALQAAAAPFDAIVLDYRLPDSNDFTLLSKLRELSPRSRIIMITAHGSPEIIDGAISRGAYAVVAKPFDMHELRDLLQRPA